MSWWCDYHRKSLLLKKINEPYLCQANPALLSRPWLSSTGTMNKMCVWRVRNIFFQIRKITKLVVKTSSKTVFHSELFFESELFFVSVWHHTLSLLITQRVSSYLVWVKILEFSHKNFCMQSLTNSSRVMKTVLPCFCRELLSQMYACLYLAVQKDRQDVKNWISFSMYKVSHQLAGVFAMLSIWRIVKKH